MRTWVLLAACIALAAFIFWKPVDSGFKLSESDPASISRIRIAPMGGPVIQLGKDGHAWEIVAPVKAPARQDAVERILSILEARSDHRIETRDLSRFGLEAPLLRLTLDAEEFDFGMLNPLTQKQYVGTGGKVYLISPKYELMPSLSDLEEHAGTP